MRRWMYGVALVLLTILTEVTHSASGGQQEVIVKLASDGFSGLPVPRDCPAVVAWMIQEEPALAGAHCQILRGAVMTFRLRWTSASPVALSYWLTAEQQAGRLAWFEFSGAGLRTQATGSLEFYAGLTAALRAADTPDFVDGEALRLHNLVRIYRPAGMVTVAVIDSGVNFDSTRLAPLRYQNSGEIGGNGIDDDGNGYVDDVSGWDFVDEGFSSWFDDTQTPDNDPKDWLGHGTAVASIAAATVGSTGADWLRILPLRVASGTNGVGSASPFALAEAIHYAVAMNAQVINLSVGSAQSYEVVTEAIANALSRGVRVIVASGNTSGPVLFPAGLTGVLAVGALDANGQIWSGSARGQDVALYLRGTDMLSQLGGGFSGLSRSGTSYAAPSASAMTAMLLAVAGDCEATTQIVRIFHPQDQSAAVWVATLVNQFESEVQATGELSPRWVADQVVCGAHLTVGSLLRRSDS